MDSHHKWLVIGVWCFSWYHLEHADEQTVEFTAIWDTMALMWCHCNDILSVVHIRKSGYYMKITGYRVFSTIVTVACYHAWMCYLPKRQIIYIRCVCLSVEWRIIVQDFHDEKYDAERKHHSPYSETRCKQMISRLALSDVVCFCMIGYNGAQLIFPGAHFTHIVEL